MTFDELLLFLHVLAAFALVAGLVVITGVVLSARSGGSGPALSLGGLGQRLGGAGGVGTLVFGVWLALKQDAYGILDGWIIGALVLWAASGAAAGILGKRLSEAGDGDTAVLGSSRVSLLLGAYLVGTFGILVLMVWKPGV